MNEREADEWGRRTAEAWHDGFEGRDRMHAHRAARETLGDRIPDLILIIGAILIVGYFSRDAIVEYGFGVILGAMLGFIVAARAAERIIR